MPSAGGSSNAGANDVDSWPAFHARNAYSREAMKHLPRPLTLLFGLALLAPPLAAAAQDDPYRIPLEDEDDIRGGLTQEELEVLAAKITPMVAEMRGWEWKEPVAVGITTPEEFTAFAVESFDEEIGPEKLHGMNVSARLFRWIKPDQDMKEQMLGALESAVGGYYDPESKHFYMMSTFNQGAMAEFIMAHELQHALDDQYYPLMPIYERASGNSDREFAARCVVEGSASLIGNRYLMKGAQEGWLNVSEMMDLDMLSSMVGSMDEAPAWFIIGLSLPYLDGASFLVRQQGLFGGIMGVATHEDLHRAFTTPPTSSEQILHPKKYWEEESFDPPEMVELADASESLGEGWSLADTDTMGELGCAVFGMKRIPTPLQVSAGFSDWRHDHSMGWEGGQYRAYVHEDGRSMMHWRTLWESEKDAQEFADAAKEHAQPRLPDLHKIEVKGKVVNLLFASEGAKSRLRHLNP